MARTQCRPAASFPAAHPAPPPLSGWAIAIKGTTRPGPGYKAWPASLGQHGRGERPNRGLALLAPLAPAPIAGRRPNCRRVTPPRGRGFPSGRLHVAVAGRRGGLVMRVHEAPAALLARYSNRPAAPRVQAARSPRRVRDTSASRGAMQMHRRHRTRSLRPAEAGLYRPGYSRPADAKGASSLLLRRALAAPWPPGVWWPNSAAAAAGGALRCTAMQCCGRRASPRRLGGGAWRAVAAASSSTCVAGGLLLPLRCWAELRSKLPPPAATHCDRRSLPAHPP